MRNFKDLNIPGLFVDLIFQSEGEYPTGKKVEKGPHALDAELVPSITQF